MLSNLFNCLLRGWLSFYCLLPWTTLLGSLSLKSDLQRIRNWCFGNCLMLNPDKTKLMVFGSRGLSSKLLDIKLSPLGKDIHPAPSVKDLGVISDPTLSFDIRHISTVVSSCMSKLSQISRIRLVFDKQVLKIIINALVFSKLYCCSSVWSSTSACNIRKLLYVQNFAARTICNVKKYNHIFLRASSFGR